MSRQEDWDEYVLVQEKIDKFSDATFKVKTWSVTVMSALLIGIAATNTSPLLYLLTLFPILSFYLLERYQKMWQNALSSRARVLDRSLHPSTPGVGPRPQMISQAIHFATRDALRSRWGRIQLNANGLFYLLQGVMVFLVVAFSYIGTHDEQEESQSITPVTVDLHYPLSLEVVVSRDGNLLAVKKSSENGDDSQSGDTESANKMEGEVE
ncbi:MAG: hypothetical protein AAFY08_04180 [Planctomycetota bacterium]